MIVDAHRHYWDPARLTYAWLAQAPVALQRAWLPGDGDSDMQGDACVLVQAAPDERETRFLFELAHHLPGALGVVGWTDLEAPDAGHRLDALIADGGGLLRGIRPMVQDLPDTAWLTQRSLDRAFDAVRDHRLVFDALVDTRHLRGLLDRLDRHPGLAAVIDHAAKPDITGAGFAAWASAMARLAQMPDVYCKLSGLLTLTGATADAQTLTPYVAHLFETFGTARLIWGSDWPVVTTQASYAEWKRSARDLVCRHAPHAEAAIFGGNAIALYGLVPRSAP